jgi:hypothetical protein
MKKFRPNWLNREMCQPGPYLCLVLSANELKAAVEHMAGDKPHLALDRFPKQGAKVTFYDHEDGDTVAIVQLSESAQREKPCVLAALLVHEASHVVDAYFDDLGEKEPASEQRAYAMQIVSQHLFIEFDRRMRERK